MSRKQLQLSLSLVSVLLTFGAVGVNAAATSKNKTYLTLQERIEGGARTNAEAAGLLKSVKAQLAEEIRTACNRAYERYCCLL